MIKLVSTLLLPACLVNAESQPAFTAQRGTTGRLCHRRDKPQQAPKTKEEWQEMLQSFGRYKTDKDFEKTSPAFLSLARRQWLKYVKSFE